MRILVVNDDGIKAPGIERLARFAAEHGEVHVVAPMEQCSGMSARITIFDRIEVKKVDYPVPGVDAHCISGTPADCVKVALEYLKIRPDLILSGINKGFNAGVEISYSGTVAAAMEGLMKGIPAMAFSVDWPENYGAVDAFLPDVLKELMTLPISRGEIWNVNFPSCDASECKGILRDRVPAHEELYPDGYKCVEKRGDSSFIVPDSAPITGSFEGSDLDALLRGYISIGKLKNVVLNHLI
jgi:5'-nucleotidase